jgi:hypothetical protein
MPRAVIMLLTSVYEFVATNEEPLVVRIMSAQQTLAA